jgi:hypothetical protein
MKHVNLSLRFLYKIAEALMIRVVREVHTQLAAHCISLSGQSLHSLARHCTIRTCLRKYVPLPLLATTSLSVMSTTPSPCALCVTVSVCVASVCLQIANLTAHIQHELPPDTAAYIVALVPTNTSPGLRLCCADNFNQASSSSRDERGVGYLYLHLFHG